MSALIDDAVRLAETRRRMGPPPRSPREWTVCVRLRSGVEPATQVPDEDALAAALRPPGWTTAGAIICSARDATTAPDWRGWYVRLKYWPAEWSGRTTLLAAPAVYAAAQIAGLPTRLDGCLIADHDGIQYVTPDHRPIARQCWWEGREQLPPAVLRDLARIASIDRLRSLGGHMRGRPFAARALAAASALDNADTRERPECCARVAAWIRGLPGAASILRDEAVTP